MQATRHKNQVECEQLIHFVRSENLGKGYANIPISHHTGAQLMALPFHTMESTKNTRQANAVQIKYMLVPTCAFHDCRCHHSGTTERKKPIPENTVNAVFDAVILALRRPCRRIERGITCPNRGMKKDRVGSIVWHKEGLYSRII